MITIKKNSKLNRSENEMTSSTNMFKVLLLTLMSLTVMKIQASPLLFSNGFETPPGSIEFVSDESVLFTQAGDSASFEVIVKDYQGNVINTGDVQWSLSSNVNLSTSNPQSRTVSVEANGFSVNTVLLTAHHPEANATGQANIILAEISTQTKIVLDEDVISGNTPINGSQNTIVLQKNTRTENIQVGDNVISGQNTGLLVSVDQVNVNANDVTILASQASFTDAFETLNFSGVNQISSYHAKIYGSDNKIEIRDKKNGVMIYQKSLYDLFSCELSGGGPAGINLSGASIDFEYNITITPDLDLSFFTINGMSLVAETETVFAFTTGSVTFDSSISGEVDCKVQSLPNFEAPPVIVYGLWLNFSVTPSLGIKLEANIDGPSAVLSGPTGIASSQTQSGVKYTAPNGWEYIDTNQFNYQFDLIDGEFSNNVAFSFNAEAYATANMSVDMSLGKPPLGIEIGSFAFMEAQLSETFDFSISTPLDPNNLNYTGPDASLEGRFVLTPQADLSGAVFGEINEVLGFNLDFNLNFDPLINAPFPHWVSPKPVINAPASAPADINTQISVQPETPDAQLNGTFQLITDIIPTDSPDFSGDLVSGTGHVDWIPHTDDEGMVLQLYPRMSVDGLSQILPYANSQPTTITIEEMLITDVVFADSNLEACVLSQAQTQGWTYVSEFLWVNCSSSNITDISGIESFPHIYWLNLRQNQISNVSALGSLTQMTYSYLEYNQISDISALATLTQLIELTLHNNQISNVSALESLTQLTILNLYNNQISDISVLGSLTQLTNLGLGNNQISDVSVLSSLTQLIYLDLTVNQVTSISALGSLTQLTSLNLYSNQISDVSALGSLTQLTYLDLSNNQITSVSALGSLTQLTFLSIHLNQIVNVSALGSLTQLTYLGLSDNQVTSVSTLGSLTQLTVLELFNNQISDVSALGSLTQLTLLSLHINQISDVSALGSLTQLTWLSLSSNDNLIPCSQLAQYSYVSDFYYDSYYDVDGDGEINLPITDPNHPNYPGGVDEQCGPF